MNTPGKREQVLQAIEKAYQLYRGGVFNEQEFAQRKEALLTELSELGVPKSDQVERLVALGALTPAELERLISARRAEPTSQRTGDVRSETRPQQLREFEDAQASDSLEETLLSGWEQFKKVLLIMVAGAAALGLVAGIIGFVYSAMQPTPAELLAEELAEPSRVAFIEASNRSEASLVSAGEVLTSDQKDSWQAFLTRDLRGLATSVGIERFCEGMKNLNAANIARVSYPVDECASHQSAMESLKEAERKNSSTKSDIGSTSDRIERLKTELQENQESLAPIQYPITGSIIAELEPNVYEVSVDAGFYGNTRAVLRTLTFEYTTQGRFRLHARRFGNRSMQMKNGTTQQFPYFEEVPDSLIVSAKAAVAGTQSELRDARSKLHDLQDDFVETSGLKSSTTAAEDAVLKAIDEPAQERSVSARESEPPQTEAGAEVEKESPEPEPKAPKTLQQVLAGIADSEELRYLVHRRRIAALHNLQKTAELESRVDSLVSRFPEKEEQIRRDVLKACFDASDQGCVRRQLAAARRAGFKFKKKLQIWEEAHPAEPIPKMAFKVPHEWREKSVPSGSLTELEEHYIVEAAAIEAYKDGRLSVAKDLYDWLLLQPVDSRVHVHFGLSYGKFLREAFGQETELRYYEKLLKKFPDNVDLQNRMGWILMTTEDPSLSDIDRGIEFADAAARGSGERDPTILDTVAEYKIRKGRIEDARADLGRAIALDPTREYYRNRVKSLDE